MRGRRGGAAKVAMKAMKKDIQLRWKDRWCGRWKDQMRSTLDLFLHCNWGWGRKGRGWW